MENRNDAPRRGWTRIRASRLHSGAAPPGGNPCVKSGGFALSTALSVSQSTRPFIAGTAKQCRIHSVNDAAIVAASLFFIWPRWSTNRPLARIRVQPRKVASFRFSIWSWRGPHRIEPFTEIKQVSTHPALWASHSPRGHQTRGEFENRRKISLTFTSSRTILFGMA